jgi:ribonuclease HI
MNEDRTELKQIIIYTDGACIGNPGPGGYGVVLVYSKHKKELSGGFRLTTNNRMEIMAAIVGLEALKVKCAVTIYSDSQLLVDSISKGWVYEWRRRGWKRKKKRALNADLWKRLLDLCDQHEVQFVWVRGHEGDPGNERAHDLSMQAACGSDLTTDKAYEEGKTQIRHPSLFSLRKAETGRQDVRIELDGENYVWTGSDWYEAETFLQPPEVVIRRLNRLLSKELAQEDANTSDVCTLLERASKAREALQHERAERLARQCLKLDPNNHAALAVLCAVLRARGLPQKALGETNNYRDTDNVPLLTSRAAALCDLKRWEEAKRTIGRALAIEKSEEAFNVVHRIKAARPDLYED